MNTSRLHFPPPVKSRLPYSYSISHRAVPPCLAHYSRTHPQKGARAARTLLIYRYIFTALRRPRQMMRSAGHLCAQRWAMLVQALASTIIEAPPQFIRQQGYM